MNKHPGFATSCRAPCRLTMVPPGFSSEVQQWHVKHCVGESRVERVLAELKVFLFAIACA